MLKMHRIISFPVLQDLQTVINRKFCRIPGILSAKHGQLLFRQSSTDVTANASTTSVVRPPEEIPGPRSFPVIGTIYKFLPGGEYHKMNDLNDIARLKFKKYGSIVRQEFIPGMFVTSLFDPNDFEKVYKNEGENRRRPQFDCIRMYFEKRKRVYSLASREGEEWKMARSIIQKPMMRPQSIAAYLPKQVTVTDDFIDYLRKVRDPSTLEVKDMLNQSKKWSMEAVGVVCFSRRLGVLTLNPDPELKEFMHATMFFIDSVAELLKGIPLYKYYETKALKNFFAHFDALFK